MTTEVRASHLRPRAFAARKAAVPVAYLPVGTVEWHGFQNPLGLDGLKAELLCVEAARSIGGVVFPTLFYGDHRGAIIESLLTPELPWAPRARGDHRAQLATELGTTVDLLAATGQREQAARALAQQVQLLERVLWQLRAYGFTRIVAVAGHYPNAWGLGPAVARFEQAQSTCRVVHGTEVDLGEVGPGDHAGAFETSLMLALSPELVDLDELEPDDDGEPLGAGGVHPSTSTVAFGRAIVEGFVTTVRRRIDEVGVPAFAPRPGVTDEDGTTLDWPAPLAGLSIADLPAVFA